MNKRFVTGAIGLTLLILANPLALKRGLVPLTRTSRAEESTTNSPTTPDIDIYLHQLRQAMGKVWPPDDFDRTGEAVATFTVNRNGTISQAAIANSSGQVEFDTAVLDVLRLVSPLQPLPNSYTPDSLEITFTFTLEAGQGDRPENTTISDAYMHRVREAIGDVWPPDGLDVTGTTVVEFSVNREGTVSDVQVIDSAENADIDSAAIAAVTSISPLDPLPNSYSPGSLRVTYTLGLENNGGANPRIPSRHAEAIATYSDCLDIADAELRSPRRQDFSRGPRSGSMQLSTTVLNACEETFANTAWTATIFDAEEEDPIVTETALASDLAPGDTAPLVFHLDWDKLTIDENRAHRSFSSEIRYTIQLSTATVATPEPTSSPE